MKRKHHFNLIVDAGPRESPFSKEDIRETETNLARLVTDVLEDYDGKLREVEVVYVETFDADKEEMGGEPATHQHDADCYAQPTCTLCHRRKAPRGRLVPDASAGSYCTADCGGYYADPQPGHLWPSEREAPKSD